MKLHATKGRWSLKISAVLLSRLKLTEHAAEAGGILRFHRAPAFVFSGLLRHCAHNDDSLSVSQTQCHRLFELDWMLLTVNTDDEIC